MAAARHSERGRLFRVWARPGAVGLLKRLHLHWTLLAAWGSIDRHVLRRAYGLSGFDYLCGERGAEKQNQLLAAGRNDALREKSAVRPDEKPWVGSADRQAGDDGTTCRREGATTWVPERARKKIGNRQFTFRRGSCHSGRADEGTSTRSRGSWS